LKYLNKDHVKKVLFEDVNDQVFLKIL
jgi:hypothetical protein